MATKRHKMNLDSRTSLPRTYRRDAGFVCWHDPFVFFVAKI